MRNDTYRSAFLLSFFRWLFYHQIKRHPCLNARVVVQVLQAFVVVVIHAQLLFHGCIARVVVQVLQAFVVVVIHAQLLFHGCIEFIGLVHRFHQAGEEVLLFRPFGHLVVVAEVGFLAESVFYPLAS